MSIINQKKEVFGKIASNRILLEGFPKLSVNPSFPSINNATNSLSFLTDLLGSLSGMESLKDVVIETLTYNLKDIEKEIKSVIKTELNKMVSCDINPSIPKDILHKKYNSNSPGINLELKKIDFNNLLLVNPTSYSGGLLYKDINSGVNSKDFNTYLFSTIQSETTNGWGHSTIGEDILDIEFNENGPINNTINVKVSEYYSNPTNKKTLKDLNNHYIDSIELFNVSELVSKLMDGIFGTISNDQKKSKDQILNEIKLNHIIDSIMNKEDGEDIDNSFFQFSNEELTTFDVMADNQQRGVKVVVTTKAHETGTNIETLKDVAKSLEESNENDLPQKLRDSLDKISKDITSQIPDIDKYAVNLDFIQDIVKNLMRIIGGIILSPKVTTILALNHNVIYGTQLGDPIEFIEKNKVFIKMIFDGIRDVVINALLNRVLKDIKDMVTQKVVELGSEQIVNHQSTIKSLLGVPIEVINKIKAVTK